MTQPDDSGGAPAPDPRRKASLSLAGLLASQHFPTGDLAALRRLEPDSPGAPVFWRLLFRLDDEARPVGVEAEGRWALILKGMALMAPSHHRPGARPGRVLRDTDFSEQRLSRLLRAPGPAFRDMVPRVCRFLAAKGQPLDWVRFGELILAADGSAAAERHRRDIARDYYGAATAAVPDTQDREGANR